MEENRIQKGLIITDDIEVNPILDFNLYRKAIIKLIKESYPKFTIGIFGDWGTGKSTLMDSISQSLVNDPDIVKVHFETWRYEREDQFALIPLLKTIVFALPKDEKFDNLKNKLKRGAITFLKKTPDIFSPISSGYLGINISNITKEVADSFRNEFNKRLELLAEVDRDTLYFDGFEDIKKEILKLRDNNPSFKIVVFVDDLDRCSPKKALEVLESIKVFLGMDGFIYILGLSHKIVTKLIDLEYKKMGIDGEQYIKKMIQIPITLPQWNNDDLKKLIISLIDKEFIQSEYKKIITDNMELISTAIENTPREIKRFINKFIVAHQIFSSLPDFDPKELLLIQVIQLRWNDFYNVLIEADKTFINELEKYLKLSEQELNSIFKKKTDSKQFDLKIRKELVTFKEDFALWDFLKKHFEIIKNIKNYSTYRRAAESIKDISVSSNLNTDDIEYWIDNYLFSNPRLVSTEQIRKAIEGFPTWENQIRKAVEKIPTWENQIRKRDIKKKNSND